MTLKEMFGNAVWVSSEKECPAFILKGKFNIENLKKATLRVVGLGFFNCKINGKAYEYYVYDDSKWYEKILRRIKKWLGIVSPTEDRPPWEEQNCDLSLKFKEDYK